MNPLAADQLLRTLSEDGSVSVRALVGSALVREAARRHETSPVATAALGRTLLGAVLLASQGKDAETVELRFRARGPLGHVVAIADDAGRVRGYAANPRLDLPLRAGRLAVSSAVGLGELAVARFRPGWREPYTGIVPIVSGEIAEDIALYLTESEQTPSTLALGLPRARRRTGGGWWSSSRSRTVSSSRSLVSDTTACRNSMQSVSVSTKYLILIA